MNIVVKFYSKYQLFIKPVASSIFSVAALVFIIIPQILSYTKTNSVLSDNQTKLGILQAKADELDSLDTKDYQKNVQIVFSALPEEKQVPQALIALQTLVGQSGLLLDTARVSDDTGSGAQKSFQIQLVLLGSVDRVRSFLIGLKNSPRLFRVDNISSISNPSNKDLETDITLSVFYQEAPASLGSIDSPLPKITEADQLVLDQLSKASNSAGGLLLATQATGAASLGKTDPFQ